MESIIFLFLTLFGYMAVILTGIAIAKYLIRYAINYYFEKKDNR